MDKGSRILVTKTLKDYDELLSGYGFMRILHLHFIILNYMRKSIKGEARVGITADEFKIELSRCKKGGLMEYLETMKLNVLPVSLAYSFFNSLGK